MELGQVWDEQLCLTFTEQREVVCECNIGRARWVALWDNMDRVLVRSDNSQVMISVKDYELSLRMTVMASVVGVVVMIGLGVLAAYLDKRDE